ncbi:MAG: MFS transporter [SAR202 cluster bacterium Io17-Chloro-G3]|nr:MAG: MFS transporter [SAR202 cluster bacterium Io17-Chloro-G3]
MSSSPVIEVEHLSKYYGHFPAVTDVSFTVGRGEILGFLGPNGAGKTTTMKVLTGFIPPTSGVVKIAGFDVVSESLNARKQVGYLPETVPLYTDMTIRDYLNFMGTIRGMEKVRIVRRINEVVDLCNLGDYQDTLIGKLSKGYRQRVGIAQAIIHEPDILILDEPTIGIDPIQVVETRQLIKSLGSDHTLIVSTHILPEVSTICERVIILHEGEVVAVDRPENLGQRLQLADRTKVEIRGPTTKVAEALRSIKDVQDVSFEPLDDTRSAYTLTSRRGHDLREDISRVVVGQDWGLLKLEAVSMTLEEIFLKLTTEEPTDETSE